MANNHDARRAGRALIWDWPTRLFHWALLVSVVFSWVAIDLLDNAELHMKSGQVILGLLAFRLIWGVIGSASAQFHRFIRGPRTIVRYLRGESIAYVGHNPLGALSVIGMLVCLIVQVLTGLANDDDIFSSGPLAKYLSSDMVATAHWIHQLNWNVLLALVALHLLAIVYYWRRGKNLVKPMITGKASAPADAESQSSVEPRPLWRAGLAIGLAIAFAVWVFTL